MRVYPLIAAIALPRLTICSILSFTREPGKLQIAANDGDPVQILCAENEHDGVVRAAQDLALDFDRVLSVNGTVLQNPKRLRRSDSVVIVGTIGKSSIIDDLIEKSKLDVSEIEGKWESYIHTVIKSPLTGVSEALVIAGSDKRGSIYGIYDVSETTGVSPWHYWASIPPKTKNAVFADPKSSKVQGPPSVKYRGIFINDEWELIAWSKGKFPQSSRSGTYFTHEFYSLVFELLLRLRANSLWPGMKNSAAFFADDTKNGEAADMYGVLMGTSHHEPMALSYDEQKSVNGPWDWSENREEITDFMRTGVERAKEWETLWTMGMRGEGDRESPTLTATQLEEILEVQEEMLHEELGEDVRDIPQIWTLYKEVGKYWAEGMNVPDKVTLMWADDNFGNLLRIPLANETNRSGGHGIYYHFGYVGDPRSYCWISTIQMIKTWEQMHLAYERGAKEAWIVNVQNIKVHELSTSHFLDMAYDMTKFQSPQSTTEWLKQWAARNFSVSKRVASNIATIVNTYGRLVLRRKYETLNMNPFAFSVLHYEEASNVLREWEELCTLAQKTYDRINPDEQDAFWQLFVYPAKAGKHVFELYIARELGYLYKSQGRTSTNAMSLQAIQAFADDAQEESSYNTLFGGLWKPFVSYGRIGYEGRHIPGAPYGKNIMPEMAWMSDPSSEKDIGVAIPGSNTSSLESKEPLELHSIDRYAPGVEENYIDIFTAKNGTFSYEVKSNSSFVKITPDKGVLEFPGGLNMSHIRCAIKVDWSKAPSGLSWVSLEVFSNKSHVGEVLIPLNNPQSPHRFRNGYIESNGAVSMAPHRWSRLEKRGSSTYAVLPWYGKTSSEVKLWPVTAETRSISSGPKLIYDFYSFSDARNASLIVYLGASMEHDPSRPLKLAYSLDSNDPEEIRVLEDYTPGSYPVYWDTAVITGGWNVTSKVCVSPGKHSLNMWLLEPGVVVEKIVLDLGGMRKSALGPPESLFME